MASLDVTEILTDPLLASTFAVIRRVATVDTHGRQQTTDTTIPDIAGVITPFPPSDLDRQADFQTYSRSISVITKFPLQGETSSTQPDYVLWKGSRYLVKHVDSCLNFGPGFVEATCSSIEKKDPMQTVGEGGSTSFDFSKTTNSQYGALLC